MTLTCPTTYTADEIADALFAAGLLATVWDGMVVITDAWQNAIASYALAHYQGDSRGAKGAAQRILKDHATDYL